MKRLFIYLIICILTLLFVGLYYYNSWKPLWSKEEPRKIYLASYPRDDTLRIIMIGDSWVELRTDKLNKLFKKRLSMVSGLPVILKTKGKGGEKSRGVYQLIFEENGYGTKPLFLSGADYCVVFVGINDAIANLGKNQFVYHLKLIIDFLMANNICPVLIEIPNVNIWNVYSKKPIKDLLVDYIRSLMSGSSMYHFSEYREAVLSMLKDSALIDSVIYVHMSGWNGDNDLNGQLFLDDQIHLNQKGYLKLDSCIIEAIKNKLN